MGKMGRTPTQKKDILDKGRKEAADFGEKIA